MTEQRRFYIGQRILFHRRPSAPAELGTVREFHRFKRDVYVISIDSLREPLFLAKEDELEPHDAIEKLADLVALVESSCG